MKKRKEVSHWLLSVAIMYNNVYVMIDDDTVDKLFNLISPCDIDII
jgi:hypothetical protein